jgi:hypothetical protein
MSLASKKKFVYINSRNRMDGDDSDFTFTIDIKPTDNFDKVVLLSCLIPKSFYIVQSNQNTFILKENSSQVTISVPIGSYNRRSFASTLSSTLTNASPNHLTYTISYPTTTTSPDTGKYTFSSSSFGGTIQFIFTTFMFEQLGFNENSINSFNALSLTSSNVFKMASEDV